MARRTAKDPCDTRRDCEKKIDRLHYQFNKDFPAKRSPRTIMKRTEECTQLERDAFYEIWRAHLASISPEMYSLKEVRDRLRSATATYKKALKSCKRKRRK
jgi:hypothetical protein